MKQKNRENKENRKNDKNARKYSKRQVAIDEVKKELVEKHANKLNINTVGS